MSKSIEIELGVTAINNAVKELKKYKLWIIRKNRSIIYHLMQVGWESVQSSLKTVKTDDGYRSKKVDRKFDLPSTNFRGTVVEGHLIATSPNIMFLEFGAGIHYNTPVGSSPHPKSAEYGGKLGGIDTTIGSYSDIGNGYSLGQFDSWTHEGKVVHGTEAGMPMYNAWRQMKAKYASIAKEQLTKNG